ncbi:MAG: B12-binding domain-containing radical SAM protein, partial [Deltaproteobacteria bacterium]|nr:B12-binding domain-containing radical SAM protein [Deltaproteobacteria bacterium]
MKTLNDILPFVEQPSRYLGTETNIIKKNHHGLKLRMALAFPDLYEIGTSHFGLQILYNILNNHKSIVAERVFAPALDFGGYLRSSDT